jgi:hypothetical protein
MSMLAAENDHRRHAVIEQPSAVPARLYSSARRLRRYLPTDWPWHQDWQRLFDKLRRPPRTA